MLWVLYNLLFPIGFCALLPWYLLRMARRGGYRRGFLQRLAVYDPDLRRRLAARGRLWIHAVSVGEVYVALRFMQEWRRRRPDAAFVLSTTTSTGHALAARELPAEDVLVYFPVDVPPVVRRVLRILNPEALVLTECELWPNLIRHAHARGVPVILLNGRLSAKSYRGYRRVRVFFRPVLRCLALLCAQGPDDAERLVALGADPARVRVMGSAKYDVAARDPLSAQTAESMLRAAGVGASSLTLVGGSTWPGEEAALLDVYGRLKGAFPNLRLVLVPRHAERRRAVLDEICRRNLTVALRSELRDSAGSPPEPPDVLLVDTTGELRHLYAVGTVIFVGKSLTRRGGQNLIEAAVCGRPILVGPHMENFAGVMKDFLDGEAVVQVANAGELEAAVARLLEDTRLRQAYGERAAAVVARKRGAIAATAAAAAALLPPTVPSV